MKGMHKKPVLIIFWCLLILVFGGTGVLSASESGAESDPPQVYLLEGDRLMLEDLEARLGGTITHAESGAPEYLTVEETEAGVQITAVKANKSAKVLLTLTQKDPDAEEESELLLSVTIVPLEKASLEVRRTAEEDYTASPAFVFHDSKDPIEYRLTCQGEELLTSQSECRLEMQEESDDTWYETDALFHAGLYRLTVSFPQASKELVLTKDLTVKPAPQQPELTVSAKELIFGETAEFTSSGKGERSLEILTSGDYLIFSGKTIQAAAVGTASFQVTYDGIVDGYADYEPAASAIAEIVIHPASLEKADQAKTLKIEGIVDKTYTGNPAQQKITVRVDSVKLDPDTDYVVSYQNNTAAGQATVFIEGTGNYTGTVSRTFVINKAAADQLKVSGVKNKTFTGDKIELDLKVKLGKTVLVSGTDYQVKYENNKNVGTASLTITSPNLEGSIQKTFEIKPLSLKGAEISGVKDKTFDGKTQKQKDIKVTLNGRTLKKKRDYSISFTDRVHAGEVKITLKGVGNYKDEISTTFVIKPRSLKKAEVTGIKDRSYTGEAIVQKLKVRLDGKTLKADRDYTLAYKNNVNGGKATVTVQGIGDYKGSVKKTFTINPIKNKLKAKNIKTKFSTRDRILQVDLTSRGEARFVYKSDNAKVKVNSKGRITIKAEFSGTAHITIQAKANRNYLAAETTMTVTVKPLKTKFMRLKKAIMTKNPCYSRYYQKIAVQGLMLHSVGVAQPSAESFVRSWNDPGYTRACVHGFIDANTGVVYQTLPWDNRGWHAGDPANSTHIGVEMCESSGIQYVGGNGFYVTNRVRALADTARTYNSAVELFALLCADYGLDPMEPGVIISHKEGALLGIATNHGDPEHLWEGLGTRYTMDGFRADVKKQMETNGFDPAGPGVGIDINGDSITVSKVSRKSFTGQEITPKITVKDGNTKLKKNKDYKITYSNNVMPGRRAAIKIRGIGDYTGTRTVYFWIHGTYTTRKTTVDLNYRKQPGLSGTIVGELPAGTRVRILKGYSVKKDGILWKAARINKKLYYVSGLYLKK